MYILLCIHSVVEICSFMILINKFIIIIIIIIIIVVVVVVVVIIIIIIILRFVSVSVYWCNILLVFKVPLLSPLCSLSVGPARLGCLSLSVLKWAYEIVGGASPLQGRRQKHEKCGYTYMSISKVKFTLVQALRLCTGHMAHRGSRGIALLFHDQRH